MSRYVPQDELESATLFRLFSYVQDESESLEANEVKSLFQVPFTEKRIKLALEVLERRNYVSAHYSSMVPATYEISDAGYRAVEAGLSEVDGFFQNFSKFGDEWLIRSEDSAVEAPASDRIVKFNDNDPDFASISEQLKEVREAVRFSNDIEGTEEDRLRVVASLEAARMLWESANLKLIQIKVGVLLAVEDAKALLISTSKAVGIALLIDTIKAFVKAATGVDLDNF